MLYWLPYMEKPEFPIRINKYLALHGHSTRRGADVLIESKQVFINGKHAVLGDKVEEKDVVEVRLKGKQKVYKYIAYNKPRGIVTHSAQDGEKEILTEVPVKGVFPIGRLDKESHGLIILTDDGRITDRLLGFKEKMEAGVQIDDEKTAPCRVNILNDFAFKIILTEGKKHQIRRMCVALFQEVLDLQRIRIMNIKITHLAEGDYREIKDEELKTFLHSLELV